MRTKFGFALGFSHPVLQVVLLLFTTIISSSSSESTLPQIYGDVAPAPAPAGTFFATDPSEVAVLRAIPAISWAAAAANDPCSPPSTWPGVTCVLRNQSSLPAAYHVSGIELSRDTPQALSILLSVASQLGYLQSLRVTRTTSSSPSFSISIPESIGQVQQLRHLDLSENGLHLGGPIPGQLGSLSKLRLLGLAGNQLTGSIPEELCTISSLKYLDLSRNQLQGPVPACLGNSSSLRVLDLGSNRLRSRIPAELGQLSSLLYLNLENNRLQGEVPESLGSLRSLQTLRCGRNMLEGALPRQLGQARSLQVLDFSLNSDIAGSIPASLGSLSDIVELSLFSMGLNGTIPSELGKLRNLSALRLHSNSISGSIPGSFSELSSLKVLQLQGNQLSGSLPRSVFKRLSGLQGLYLQINSFTGVLPVEITRMPNLSVLNLGFNQLDGELPETLGSMPSLEWLLLGRNRFSGQIPASLGELRKLRLLDLSNNLLVGSVPASILDAASIEKNLHFNQLNSTGLLHNLCLQPPCSQQQDHSPDITSNRISDSFAINAGGPEHILTSRHLFFQADDVFANTSVGYFVGNPTCSASSASWAISLSGSTASSRIISTNSSTSGIDSRFVEATQELYTTARVGGDSIAYYGRCLKPGSYAVELHFIELENYTVDSPGRRVFDVFLQEQRVHEKLDVFRVAGGPFVPLVLKFQARVGEESSTLKLELRGTGSWNTSGAAGSYHGPTISAIRVYANTTSSLGISGNTSSSRMARELWAILGTSIGILAIVCITLFVGLACWLRRAEKKARMISEEEHTGGEHSISIDHIHQSLSNSNAAALATFEFSELEEATQRFSSDNLLGQGAYGRVYKGFLPDGKIVAIKQLVHRTPTCQRWFYHELQVISSVRHRNLVPLIGCCIDRGFPLLVCEFMPNGSLQAALFGRDSGIFLDWERRLQIALDVARGLQYLHEDCAKVRIIHRDVKPGNILLDEEMRAHISDFGLAKLIAHHEEAEVVVSSVMGTRGYLAPEYVINGQLSEKVDVYSYGIVLLELVSGRRGMQSSVNVGAPEPVSIDEWAWEALGSNKIEAMADPRFGRKYSIDVMVRIVQIAMWCTQGLPEQRPSMGQVVAMLVGQLGVPELPSERISWEEFKSVLEFGVKIGGATTSSIWETMDGSYQTANEETLPDVREEEEVKKEDRSLSIVAPPPSEELVAGNTVSSS
ncbi:probable LRR receptor-like serine/threonine-protein kinase At1g56130 [Selaginella moellendorffii]|uniref:probable LRR receptor-like serine/threonine-protein kinase At1g56130 n=1 Tax=Selaginella moellendorffii TaxID=88036 RepID=UPI000D1CF424|nr:probable LRR receptor-like serine/threonine-protein kinase At1g56130 [Selaginella moellendorffii]|eukprot:XP_024525702.1 probable LRR receptor-like serine/threonine-protein kinase At1g56130 [Selaginella moellendorffii]